MSKKMTKIESARTVRDFKGNCGANYDIQCRKCFNYLPKTNKCKSNSDTERLIAAQSYIKRYSRKPKEKDITRLNFEQALKDKKEFYVAVTPELSEELQKVAFECGVCWRNGTSGVVHTDKKWLNFESLGWFGYSSEPFYKTEYLPESDTFKEPVQDEENLPKMPFCEMPSTDVEWFECIDIGGVSGKNLSYRKKYKVIGRDDDMVTIVNDKGKEERVWASRFIPATDTFKEPIPKEIIGNPSDKADELSEPILSNLGEYVYEVTDYKIEKHREDYGQSTAFWKRTYRTFDEAVKIFKSKEVK